MGCSRGRCGCWTLGWLCGSGGGCDGGVSGGRCAAWDWRAGLAGASLSRCGGLRRRPGDTDCAWRLLPGGEYKVLPVWN